MLALLGVEAAQAQLPWSDDTHQIAFGDFNEDGKTDLLYVAKSPSGTSGIALSNNAGPYQVSQSWASNFHGITWHSGTYRPIVADFSGDGKADILMQRQAPGDHYLLFADATTGQITGINQTLAENLGGHAWSAVSHRIIAGDFNGDLKADVLLQAVAPTGLNAVFLAGATGFFTTAKQTWGNTHIGFRWSQKHAEIHAGDFNADGKADLFVQARPDIVLIDYEIPFLVPSYLAGSFGIANAKTENGNNEIFYTPALQIWDRKYQGGDWSAATSNVVVGDVNGDGRADIFLQSKKGGTNNSLFQATTSGQFLSGNALGDPSLLVATGDQVRIYSANFDGTPGAGLYLQALTVGGNSAIGWNSMTTASCVESFQYDALGRLRFASSCGGRSTNYNFDPAGNRSSVITTGP
jgi:hypothetical protein